MGGMKSKHSSDNLLKCEGVQITSIEYALWIAARQQDTDKVIEILNENQVDPNFEAFITQENYLSNDDTFCCRYSAYMFALWYGDDKMISAIAAAGANLHQTLNRVVLLGGTTSLACARGKELHCKQNVKLISIILQRGGNPNYIEESNGKSAYQIAIQQCDPLVIRLIENYGAQKHSREWQSRNSNKLENVENATHAESCNNQLCMRLYNNISQICEYESISVSHMQELNWKLSIWGTPDYSDCKTSSDCSNLIEIAKTNKNPSIQKLLREHKIIHNNCETRDIDVVNNIIPQINTPSVVYNTQSQNNPEYHNEKLLDNIEYLDDDDLSLLTYIWLGPCITCDVENLDSMTEGEFCQSHQLPSPMSQIQKRCREHQAR